MNVRMRKQTDIEYVWTYGLKGSPQEWGWCYKCGLKLESEDIKPHVMFHKLKEAP